MAGTHSRTCGVVPASCGKNAENHIFVNIYVYFKSPVLWQFSCQVRGSSMHLRHSYKCTTNLHFRFGPNWIWHDDFLPQFSILFQNALLNLLALRVVRKSRFRFRASAPKVLIVVITQGIRPTSMTGWHFRNDWLTFQQFQQFQQFSNFSNFSIFSNFSNFSKCPDLLKLLKCQSVIAELSRVIPTFPQCLIYKPPTFPF